MASNGTFATKIPNKLIAALDDICKKFGLRKNFVVETALREKIEDILDAYDLDTSMKEATGFHSWDEVKKELMKGRKPSTR